MTDINYEAFEKRIEELALELKRVDSDITNFDASEYLDDAEFDAFLDEIYGEVEVCGITYSTSQVLSEVDPTAYSVAKNDWAESYDHTDISEYEDLISKLSDLFEQCEEIEYELEDLRDELEDGDENFEKLNELLDSLNSLDMKYDIH